MLLQEIETKIYQILIFRSSLNLSNSNLREKAQTIHFIIQLNLLAISYLIYLKTMSTTSCQKNSQQIKHLCLAQDCSEDLFLSTESNMAQHKHSKTDIRQIKDIKQQLKSTWEPKDSLIQPYFKKIVVFYESLKKEINKLIEDDQRSVEALLTKLKYQHLPYEANSQAYLEFMRQDYGKLDRSSILNLLNEAESGSLNKNLDKQKEITNFLDLELKKVNDKVLTLKYVLLSKKIQGQLLVPHLSDPSKAASHEEFVKIYSFFNSRGLLIRLTKLIYRGSQNEYSPKAFYNRCNGINNCIAIVRTSNNKLIGGFSPLPLVYHDEDLLEQKGIYAQDKTKRGFIFNITNLKSYSLKDSTRAIRYRKNWAGPSFGIDLDINENVTSNIGNSYECDSSIVIDSLEAKVHLLEGVKMGIKQLEIWQLSF